MLYFGSKLLKPIGRALRNAQLTQRRPFGRKALPVARGFGVASAFADFPSNFRLHNIAVYAGCKRVA